MSQYYIGIDLGGTNISAALVTAQGAILCLEKVPARVDEGPAKVIHRILELSRAVQQDAGVSDRSVAAIGIGAPGIINIEKGIVLSSPNLPGWVNIPLRQKLYAATKKTVVVENDANVAAYGEKWMGAGKGSGNIIMYTIGTGVGGGILIDGEIYHGACFAAGEVGHQTILPDGPVCGCGNRGCLEALASGTAIGRAASAALELEPNHHDSPLLALCLGDPSKLTAKMVFQAAAKGDSIAKKVVEDAAFYLGIGIASLINILNPELIIIGGGVSTAGEAWLRLIRVEVKRRAMKDTMACAKIVSAKLADKAGVIGAAGIALHALQKSRDYATAARRARH